MGLGSARVEAATRDDDGPSWAGSLVAGRAQASRSDATRSAMVLTSPSSSPVTVTESPEEAPRVMMPRTDLASIGSPSVARVTAEPSWAAFCEMMAAGRAWSPTEDPTVTVLL